MAINFSLRDFYDCVSELVGIKSGLLLNRFQASQILLEEYDNSFLSSDNLNRWVRIHASDLESMLLTIRQKIGNLPIELPSQKAYQYFRDYTLKSGDFITAARSTSLGFQYIETNANITVEEMADLISKHEGYDKELSLAISIIAMERYDQSCLLPANVTWDGISELSDLYDCELNSENDFLEQKFIDYLAVNGNEIEQIHWRNFERFCAEYFKKQGYTIVLGPGTNDGGVDIRAYKELGAAPEFLIQCKRYNKENKVSIETVKSFYTDVQFENAQSGLIATTSYIAAGGKKVTETRGYNLKFAERDNIKKWAKEMWTYSK